MISLGFDASTTTVGWSFSNEDKTILDCGFIDISDVEGNRAKAWSVIEVIKNNPLSKMVDRINLEGSLSGFSSNGSRTVVVQLAKFNAVFEYVLEDYFKRKVNLVNVSTARKQLFGKARIIGVKPKIFVEEEMRKMYDLSKWEVFNKKQNLDKRMGDVRDAIVMSVFDPS